MSNDTEYDMTKLTNQILNDMGLGSFHKETLLEKTLESYEESFDKLFDEYIFYKENYISKYDNKGMLSLVIQNVENSAMQSWYTSFENGGGAWGFDSEEGMIILEEIDNLRKVQKLLEEAQELLN